MKTVQRLSDATLRPPASHAFECQLSVESVNTARDRALAH